VDFTTAPFGAADEMLTVSAAREQLAVTDKLGFATFWTGEPETSAEYGKGWFETGLNAPAPAWLTLPDGTVYQLTHQAAKQLGSTARANRKYQEFLPPEMLSEQVTWALTEGLRKKNGDGLELKLLLSDQSGRNQDDTADVPLAVAQTRATVEPFSNVRLLDVILLAIRAKFGSAAADGALVDYKLFHDLEHTSFRVVIPAVQRVIAGTGTEDDAWCYGIEVSNSLTGLKQTVIAGYLFRFATTAGLTDVDRHAGGFSRRGATPEAVYGWAADAASEILNGPELAFAGLQALPAKVVDGEYAQVMEQYFLSCPVSKELQLRIVTDLEDVPDELTTYHLATVTADAANLDGSTWREVRTVHDLAGHIVHQGGGLCDGSLVRGCRRLLPEDWEAPEASRAMRRGPGVSEPSGTPPSQLREQVRPCRFSCWLPSSPAPAVKAGRAVPSSRVSGRSRMT
jgi:hypothetical protein